MIERLTRPILYGAYQLSLLLGVVLLPVAVLLSRLGITLPVHRIVETLSAAYERTADLS